MEKHKLAQNIISDKACTICGKPIKQNVVDRCPNRKIFRCYKHEIKYKGNEARREYFQ